MPNTSSIRNKRWRHKNPHKMSHYRRVKNLKDKYGITIEDYDLMLEGQAGLCAICLRPADQLKRRLIVDHSHVTGKVRGLLCDQCNLYLGLIENDPKRTKDKIAKLLIYLELLDTAG